MSYEEKEFELISSSKYPPSILDKEFLYSHSIHDDLYKELYKNSEDFQSIVSDDRYPTTKENESEEFLFQDNFYENYIVNKDKVNENNISLNEEEKFHIYNIKKEKKKKEIKKIDYKIFHKASEEFFQLLKKTKRKIKKPDFFKVCEEKINPCVIKIEFINDNDSVIIKNKVIKKTIKKGINNKQKRKFKPDSLRKKIKARFHKNLKNAINSKLISTGSDIFFDFLPQSFVNNISKELNKEALSLTYRQILEKNFAKDDKNKGTYKKKPSKIKFEKNLKVLKYLDSHPEISEISGFNVISEMKYSDILKEYFLSSEFEESVKQLKEEKENDDYINEYIIRAKSYINFFMNDSNDDYNFESSNISDDCEYNC